MMGRPEDCEVDEECSRGAEGGFLPVGAAVEMGRGSDIDGTSAGVDSAGSGGSTNTAVVTIESLQRMLVSWPEASSTVTVLGAGIEAGVLHS